MVVVEDVGVAIEVVVCMGRKRKALIFLMISYHLEPIRSEGQVTQGQ